MKILYLANARIPTSRAYGLQIMKTCEALEGAGAQIELVVPARKVKTADDAFDYYGIKKCFEISTLRVPDLLVYGPLGFFLGAVLFVERARFMRSFATADIIYSRDALVLFQLLLIGRPLVFESHLPPSLISTIVARRVSGLVVISQGLKDAYVAAGIAQSKIVVAADAVDEDLFKGVANKMQARETLGLSPSESIVLYAGHLYPRKGADTLAAAAALLPDIKFVFVGGTVEEVAFFRQKWGGLHNVVIVGHVVHETIPFYLRAADVLVVPNSGKDLDASRFTSPMKLFEYMLAEVPIVASDVPALREVLSENMAFFATPDSPEAFANSIKECLGSPEEAARRAGAAYEHVKSFTWNTRAHTIHSFIRPTSPT